MRSMKSKQEDLRIRPLKCRSCGSRRLHAHGKPSPKHRLKARRFFCADCKKTQSVHRNPICEKLCALGIKGTFSDLVRDCGFLALGLPVQQVKNITGHKAETIQRRLCRSRDEPDLWDSILLSLLFDHDFTEDELDRLENSSFGRKDRSSPFARAFATRMDSFGPDRRIRREREGFCARIERIVGGEVGYSGSGEFWRADVDVQQIPWIRAIRAADEDKIDPMVLCELFYPIAMQVRHPNSCALELALHRPTAPAMTLSCLCDGMDKPMTLPVFMDGLKEITKRL